MEPGPLLASPPVTDQATGAWPPSASTAVNCSTDEPFWLVPLQPLQLVSMVLVPGDRLKLALLGSADTTPPAQPATPSRTTGRSAAARRSLSARLAARASSGFRSLRAKQGSICELFNKILVLSLVDITFYLVAVIPGLPQSIRHLEFPKRNGRAFNCPMVTLQWVRIPQKFRCRNECNFAYGPNDMADT